MSELKGKIDFTLFVSATNANPNGDPLNETACRIWDRKFLCSQMTERTTHSRV